MVSRYCLSQVPKQDHLNLADLTMSFRMSQSIGPSSFASSLTQTPQAVLHFRGCHGVVNATVTVSFDRLRFPSKLFQPYLMRDGSQKI